MNQLGKEYNQTQKDLVLGTMAGIIVGFGATVMLIVENPYLGAFLFAGALFIILSLKYNLFTGMVGYFFYNEKNAFSKKLTRVLIGNILGSYETYKTGTSYSAESPGYCRFKTKWWIPFGIFAINIL